MKEFGLLLSDRSAERKLCCKRPLNAVYKDDLQPELFQDVRRSRAIKAIDVKLNSLGTGLEPVSSEHDWQIWLAGDGGVDFSTYSSYTSTSLAPPKGSLGVSIA